LSVRVKLGTNDKWAFTSSGVELCHPSTVLRVTLCMIQHGHGVFIFRIMYAEEILELLKPDPDYCNIICLGQFLSPGSELGF